MSLLSDTLLNLFEIFGIFREQLVKSAAAVRKLRITTGDTHFQQRKLTDGCQSV